MNWPALNNLAKLIFDEVPERLFAILIIHLCEVIGMERQMAKHPKYIEDITIIPTTLTSPEIDD